MDCHEFRREIGEYPDREISQEKRASLETHASACPACDGALRVFRAMREGLAGMPPLRASRDFDARLARRRREERSGGAGGFVEFPAWARWTAIAAAAAIVLGIGAFLLRPDGGARRLGGDIARSTSGRSMDADRLAAGGTEGGSDGAARSAGEGGGEQVASLGHGTDGLDSVLSPTEGVLLGVPASGRSYVIDRPSDLPFLLPGGVEGEAASAPISF
jgi:hypothetical protein